MKNKTGIGGILLAVVLTAGLLLGILAWTGVLSGTNGGDDSGAGSNLPGATVGDRFSRFETSFEFVPRDSSAQDDADDVDVQVYIWDETKNDDLVAKGYLDCSAAVPALFDGDDTSVDVLEENLCVINPYKAWQVWTAGSIETYLDDYLVVEKADMDVVAADAVGDTAELVVLDTDETYLVVASEVATTDDEDVVPFAFLLTSDGTTTLDRTSLEDESITVAFKYRYYSEAAAHSKTSLSGSCDDDEDNTGINLDSSLNGAVHSSLTTATTIDLDCEVELKVTDDAYALLLVNPLASSTSEMAYIVFGPYGENVTQGSHVEYGSTGLTGDVPYSAAAVSTAQIFWAGSTGCGVTLTTSSTTDAITGGAENLYEPKCFTDSSTTYGNGAIVGIVGKGSLVIPITVDEVKVDYDLATAADDEILSSASGSSAESFFDIDLITLESGTDRIGQTLSG